MKGKPIGLSLWKQFELRVKTVFGISITAKYKHREKEKEPPILISQPKRTLRLPAEAIEQDRRDKAA